MEQIATALSEASLRKGETERLKEDLAVNEKATQGRKGDIEQVKRVRDARCSVERMFIRLVLVYKPPYDACSFSPSL